MHHYPSQTVLLKAFNHNKIERKLQKKYNQQEKWPWRFLKLRFRNKGHDLGLFLLYNMEFYPHLFTVIVLKMMKLFLWGLGSS